MQSDDEIMAEINMTPLIDIMLVLLILFMITSSVSTNSGIDVNLPTSKEANAEPKQSSAVILSLTQNGDVLVQGIKTEDNDDLVEKIKTYLEKEKSTTVILEGDQNSTLGKTVELMDLAKKAGAKDFALATETTAN